MTRESLEKKAEADRRRIAAFFGAMPAGELGQIARDHGIDGAFALAELVRRAALYDNTEIKAQNQLHLVSH